MDLVSGLVMTLMVAPGLLAFGGGRRLVRQPDDAMFAERWAAYQRQVVQFCVYAVMGLLGLSFLHEWSYPAIAIVSAIIGSFPARRQIYAESWSLPAYLSHTARTVAAILGFWLLLAETPGLIHSAGHLRHVVAAALGTILVAWTWFFPQVCLALVRAKERGDLLSEEGIAAVVARATVPAPRVFEGGPPPGQGRWVNAFALPSLRGSCVMLTRGLLSSLEPAEAAAIFAHEIAHLEHHPQARLRKALIAQLLLIVGAVFLVPESALQIPDSYSVQVWTLSIYAAFFIRMVRHRAHETESDKRAVELCAGDPEPLVRGLIKVHTLAGVPRRWDPGLESYSSHPSLAHRIQAIRGHNASTSTPSPWTETFVDAHSGDAALVLDHARVRYIQGGFSGRTETGEALVALARTCRAAPYHELVDLRVIPKNSTDIRLRAVHVSEEAHEIALHASDVSRAQALLDRVDTQLAPLARLSRFRNHARTLAAVGLLTLASSITAPAAALLLLMWPSPAHAVATAVMMILAFLLQDWASPAEVWDMLLVLPAVLGVGLLWLASRANDVDHARGRAMARRILVTLSLVCAAGCARLLLLADHSTSLLRLHNAASDTPGLAVFLVGLAVFIAAQWRTAAVKVASAWLGCAAGLVLFVGTTSFCEHFLDDPLFAPTEPIPASEEAPVLVSRIKVATWSSPYAISPSGRRVVMRDETEGVGGPGRIRIFGDAAEREVVAEKALFVDENTLITLHSDGAGHVVRTVAIPDGSTTWEVRLQSMGATDLRLAPDSATWVVTGEDGSTFVRHAGKVGKPEVITTSLPLRPGKPHTRTLLQGSGDSVLALASVPQREPRQWLGLFLGHDEMFTILGRYRESGYEEIAKTALRPHCALDGSLESFVCASGHHGHTMLWQVGRVAELLQHVVTVEGDMDAAAMMADGTWVLTDRRDGVMLYDGRNAYRWKGVRGWFPTINGKLVGLLTFHGMERAVSVYSRPRPR
ncbi:MAG: M48 family metalloprotease [Myxococcota bacterium]